MDADKRDVEVARSVNATGRFRRLMYFLSLIFKQNISVATGFKCFALFAAETGAKGASTGKPSIFVYTLH